MTPSSSEIPLSIDLSRGSWIVSDGGGNMLGWPDGLPAPSLSSRLDFANLISLEPAQMLDGDSSGLSSAPNTGTLSVAFRQTSTEAGATGYWCYDGTNWSLCADPGQASVFQLCGSMDVFTISVYSSSGTPYGNLDVTWGSLAVSPANPQGGSQYFGLLARVSTPTAPVHGLLAGEAVLYPQSSFQGHGILINGWFNVSTMSLLGSTQPGDLVLQSIQSIEVGPATFLTLNPSAGGTGEPITVCNNVEQTWPASELQPDPQSLFVTASTLNTDVGQRNGYEGTWGAFSGQGLVALNGPVLSIVAATPANDPVPCLDSQVTLAVADPTDHPPTEAVPPGQVAYRLVVNGASAVPFGRGPVCINDQGQLGFTAGGKVAGFLIHAEDRGEVSLEEISTGSFVGLDPTTHALVLGVDEGNRLRLDLRLRLAVCIPPWDAPDPGHSTYSQCVGPLHHGDVAFFAKPVYSGACVVFNHDLGETFPTAFSAAGAIGSMAVGPGTTVYLLDSGGNRLSGPLTASHADCTAYTGVAGISIERTVPPSETQVTATASLISDHPYTSAGGFGPPQTSWRTVIRVSGGPERALAPSTLRLRTMNGAPISVYSGGQVQPVTKDSPIDLTTDLMGVVTIVIPAETAADPTDLAAPALQVQLTSMDPGAWLTVHPDEGMHELLAAITGDDLLKGFSGTGAMMPEASPFVDYLQGSQAAADELAETLNAVFSTIQYDAGFESLPGEQPATTTAPKAALELKHFQTRAAMFGAPRNRRVSSARNKHKHFRLCPHAPVGQRFMSHASASEALGAFYGSAQAMGRPIQAISLEDFSLSGWLKDAWDSATEFVISAVDKVGDWVSGAAATVVEGLCIAWQYVQDGVTYIGTAVLDLVEDVVALGQWLLEKAKVGAGKVFDFLSFVFNWDALTATVTRLSNGWTAGIAAVKTLLETARKSVDQGIEDLVNWITHKLDMHIYQLQGQSLAQWQEGTPQATPTGVSAENNYVIDKVMQSTADSKASDPLSGLYDAVSTALSNLSTRLAAWTGTDPNNATFVAVMENFTNGIYDTVAGISSLDGLIAALLTALKKILQLVGILTEFAVDAFFALVIAAVDFLDSAVTTAWNVPFLSAFFQDTIGMPLNALSVASFVCAVPINLIDRSIQYAGGGIDADFQRDGVPDTISDLDLHIVSAVSYAVLAILEPWADTASAMKSLNDLKIVSDLTRVYTNRVENVSTWGVGILNTLFAVFSRVLWLPTLVKDVKAGKTPAIVGLVFNVVAIAAPVASLVVGLIPATQGASAYLDTVLGVVAFSCAWAILIVGEIDKVPEDATLGNIAAMVGSSQGCFKWCKIKGVLSTSKGVSLAVLVGMDVLFNVAATGISVGAAIANSSAGAAKA